jgi:hypothetical protein
MRLCYMWYSKKAVYNLLFAVLWTMLLVLYHYSLKERYIDDAPPSLFVMPALHSLLAICLLYYALVGLVNRTVVHVNPNTIRIKVGPLPWFGGKSIVKSDLKQLYVMEAHQKGKKKPKRVYHLHAITAQGNSIRLASHFDSPEQVNFIERQIEAYFSMENWGVDGEYNSTNAS